MYKGPIALIAAIVLVQYSSADLGIWHGVPMIVAGVAFIYFGYEMGYQRGNDKALRDNRIDSKN